MTETRTYQWKKRGGEGFARGGGGGVEDGLMQALMESAMVSFCGLLCRSLNPVLCFRHCCVLSRGRKAGNGELLGESRLLSTTWTVDIYGEARGFGPAVEGKSCLLTTATNAVRFFVDTCGKEAWRCTIVGEEMDRQMKNGGR